MPTMNQGYITTSSGITNLMQTGLGSVSDWIILRY